MQMQAQERKVTVNWIHPGSIPTGLTGFAGPDSLDVQVPKIVDLIAALGSADNGRFMNSDGNDLEY